MSKRNRTFIRSEEGAVTVDWVVLTAAVVALAGVTVGAIQTANGGVGSSIQSYLSTTTAAK